MTTIILLMAGWIIATSRLLINDLRYQHVISQNFILVMLLFQPLVYGLYFKQICEPDSTIEVATLHVQV